MSNQSGFEQVAHFAAEDLRVYLLGPPRVEWAGRPLTIHRRLPRALLYRLAARLEPIPREQLCFQFWPDTPDASARRNLTRQLTHLRRALPDPKVLRTSGGQVILDPDRVWSDTVAFEQLCATPDGETRLLQEAGFLDALQQAVDLYRGPFLAGFSLGRRPEFEAWASMEQRALEHKVLETLAALIEGYSSRRAYEPAIACAQRYLATDDLAEDVHRHLIEFYAAAGDRSAALRQYERCTEVLECELGVDPLPETQAVYEAVLEGKPSPAVAPVTEPTWTTLPGLDVPLVGRDRALRVLEQAYARTHAGQGGVVLISGEAGIGKSRLMQEFATRLRSHALVLTGAAYADAQMMPYQPVVEALRTVLRQGDKGTRGQGDSAMSPPLPVPLSPVWLAEASRLLPELRALHPDLPPPMEAGPAEARARLFEALSQLTLGLASGWHPVLLCLDDLHWADGTTLDWLAYLGRQLRVSRLLVIGTYRSEEADAVRELRRSLTRLGILSEVRLRALDVEAILRLLRHLDSDVRSAETVAGRLRQVTGGNPFFLMETLRALIEAGQQLGDLAALEEFPVPDTVREAVAVRLGRLRPMARQVLEAGAVLGASFAFDVVRQTAGRREMETVDGLDELVARQVLVEQADRYQFHHEIIRAAVYSGLSYGRRRRLHRRAGEALEEIHPNDVAVLAWHFERAQEHGKAARYVLQAGLAAKAVFAHAEARAHIDRALAALEQEATRPLKPERATANRRMRVQALYERGWVLRLLGDMEAYARDSQEVARLAEELGDQRILAHLGWREAYTHRWFCRYSEAQAAAKLGLRLARAAADRSLEAMCQREVGLAARERGDFDRARMSLGKALDVFSDLGDVVYEIHTLCNIATLCWRQGEHAEAMDLSKKALDRCDHAGLPLGRRLPLGDMGAAAAALGDFDTARGFLRESLDIARQIADRTQEVLCLGHLGWLYVRLEQPAEALEHLQQALQLAQRIGSCTEQSWLLSGLAEVHRLAGDRNQATDHAHRALKLAQANSRPYDEDLAQRTLAELESTN